MPPIQQQQTSRAGLIASLVISIMFALGFLIWGVMNNSELTKARDSNKLLSSKYKEAIDEGVAAVESDAFRSLKDDRSKNITGATVFDFINTQRSRLLQLINGGADAPDSTKVAAADGAVRKAQADVDAAMEIGRAHV